MASHSSTLAWKIPWMEEPGRLQSMGSLESDTTERLHFHFSLSCIGEGNGNPLQCSCLENPRDGGAWWAAVYRVAQSRTRLKRLSSSSSRVTFTFTFTWFRKWKLTPEGVLNSMKLPFLCIKNFQKFVLLSSLLDRNSMVRGKTNSKVIVEINMLRKWNEKHTTREW